MENELKSAGLKHLQILRKVESLNFVNKMESSRYGKITVTKEEKTDVDEVPKGHDALQLAWLFLFT